MEKVVFQLEPLSCPSCIKKIETALNKTNGVEYAKVLFNSSKVKAQYDETIVEADQLGDIIEKLGYPIKQTA